MKKFAKIILAISLLVFTLFTIFNYSFATNTITAPTSTEQATNQNSGNSSVKVSSLDPNKDDLALIIINVLLIAVGIVIIFLAIAILTRLKNK